MADFYTGSPLEPDELWFRADFIELLWESLRGEHVLLSAPRRQGKTSVMDHLAAYPRDGFSAIPVFVQDLDHLKEFLLTLLDAFHAKHPSLFKKLFRSSSGWIGSLLGKVDVIELYGFKIALRNEISEEPDAWRKLGDDEFFPVARNSEQRLLFIVDEFPDLVINMKRHHPELVRPFLGWLRGHCVNPRPKQDNIRWLIGGSVNLSSTLDSMGAIDLINVFHEERLPVLTTKQVEEFVHRMLSDRQVAFDPQIPQSVSGLMGRPIAYFLQLITLSLYRHWKRENRPLVVADVDTVFRDLIVSSAARDKLQHFYSRVQQYYDEPNRSAAYELLAKLSLSQNGLARSTLQQEFERVLHSLGFNRPEHQRKQLFNQLLRDLENDFYVEEFPDDQSSQDRYDFASGLLKSWWKKYYA